MKEKQNYWYGRMYFQQSRVWMHFQQLINFFFIKIRSQTENETSIIANSFVTKGTTVCTREGICLTLLR